MNGWAGSVLRVDLTTREVDRLPLNLDWARDFVGGRGLNSRTLYDEVGPETDPLGPDNRLIVGVGPCNGTLVPGSSSLTITTKSPLSGFLGDASTRAIAGAEIKYAGYDQIIIQGKSARPVYLWIDNNKVEVRDAAHLWGKLTGETTKAIERENRDPRLGVLCIGPAGENLVKFASIMGQAGRCAGRTGVGAVMGSKGLKAIAVRGTRGVKVADAGILKDAYLETRQTWMSRHKEAYALSKKYGMTRYLWAFQERGFLSTRNYQAGVFERWDDLNPERLAKDYLGNARSCFGCFIPCDKTWSVSRGPYAGTYGAALEVAQVHHTASRLGISNPDVVFYLDTMLNEYGLDIMDWAGVAGLAIECFLGGILTSGDTGGLKLGWGAEQAIVKLLEMVVHREGLGNILAEGVKRAAEMIGRGAQRHAIHVKGLTLDAMDPRGAKGWGLGYAISSRGADHCRTMAPDLEPESGIDRFSEDDKPAIVKWCEECRAIQHCLEVCIFCWPYYDLAVPGQLARVYTAVTGAETDGEQLLMVGERLTNLERCFNLREGLCKSDDTLPDRFTKETLPEGASKGQVVDIGRMVDRYYELRGWDVQTGVPTRATLERLGLGRMADELGLSDGLAASPLRAEPGPQ